MREQPVRSRPSKKVIAGMLAIAAIATVQAALTGAPAARTPGFDERRYELWATNLYRLGFYGDTATSKLAKEELRSVPYSAYVPPGYPFMLVTLKELHADDAATRRGVQAALVGLIVLTAGLISLRLFGPLAALLSEAILVATGVLPTYAQLNMSEILFTATLFGSIALAFFGLRRRSWHLLVCSGLLLGYAILVRPQVLLLPVPIAIYIAFVTGRSRRALALGAVFLVAAYGVVAPWTIRNELRLHAFVPARDPARQRVAAPRAVVDQGASEQGGDRMGPRRRPVLLLPRPVHPGLVHAPRVAPAPPRRARDLPVGLHRRRARARVPAPLG
ncbi:MAG: hypothetical protein E6G04_05320 [Actinobacteria bacterium]|nr:MAG: hypothetical protein E6G04_05320 [Actinomycetota bacterium]